MTFNWRDHLPVHPAAELFPPLAADELSALARDIRMHGLETPIILGACMSNDPVTLIDGRNRLDAMALLGWLRPPRERKPREPHECYAQHLKRHPLTFSEDAEVDVFHAFEVKGVNDVHALALSLNLHRRHLTREQKRELIARVLKASPEHSNARIAEQVKADDKTVAKVRADLESTSDVPRLTRTTGKDGRARTTKPKKPKPDDSSVKRTPEVTPDASAEQRKTHYAESETPQTFVECKGAIIRQIERAWNILPAEDWRTLRKLLIGTLEKLESAA